MANVKISNINTFNNTVLDLKSKIESSLKTDITSLGTTLSEIENYQNNGFNANVGDIANTLRNNLDSILKNITNAEKNLFNYASYINEFNVDDYNTEAKATNLENLYNEKYLGLKNDTDSNSSNNDSKGNSSSSNNSSNSYVVTEPNNNNNNNNNYNNDNYNDNKYSFNTNLEPYLDTIEGTTITVTSLNFSPIILNISNKNEANPNTLTIINNEVYDQDGLATFQDRYIISASKDFGKVGDLIDIKHSDGTTLKCIIGNIEEKLTTPTINFVVNQDTFKNSIQTVHPNWLNSIESIKNKGNYFDYIQK